MERFSPGRFLVLVIVLGIGVGIGAGLESLFRPSPVAPPVRAPAPPVQAPPAPPAAPGANLSCSVSATFQNNLFPSLMLSFGGLAPDTEGHRDR